MSGCFLNVDLEIEGTEPLDDLSLAFSRQGASPLYCGEANGGYLATFECEGGAAMEADAIINRFCDLIAMLDGSARSLWDRADRRIFDVGYESERTGESHRSLLGVMTIQRVAELGASLSITIYPPFDRAESAHIDEQINDA